MQSSLFRELNDSEMKAVVNNILKTEVISYRLLTGGMFNTTYLVETTGFDRVVLRLGPVNRHLLLPYEHYLMEAETEVCSLCRDAGVPISEILAYDYSKTVIDRDIMFVKYLPSRAMNEIELTESEREEIKRECGIAMRKFNGITGKKFGRPHDVSCGGGFDRCSEAVMKEIDEFELVCIPTGLFTPEQHRTIRALFENAAEIFDEIKTPHLIHFDLWEGNILVYEDTHKFAAIIDADRAIWGDVDAELACMDYWTKDSDAFWNAYGERPDESRNAKIRRALYDLLMCIWAVYIYEAEYNNEKARDGQYSYYLNLIEMIKELYN